MVSTEVKLLYDFKYVIPGRDGDIVHLKCGDIFILHEEKSDRWLAVKKPGMEDIYYVPVHYVEQFRKVNDPNIAKSLIPPKPPYKPKDLLQRMQNEDDDKVFSPPPIDEETFVELFNFLSNKDAFTGLKTENRFSSGENIDEERSPSDLETKKHRNSFSRRNKELTKKKIPVPRSGEIPLKIFSGGYEMYRDDISGQVYYYNTNSCESSWIMPLLESKSRQPSSTDFSYYTHKTKSSSEEVFPHKQWTKYGLLSRSKLTDNGGKLKKSWDQVFAVLEGTSLFFFKDQKSSSNKGKSDLTIDLENSFVLKGGMSTKQNLIHIIMANGAEFLLRADTPEAAQQWFDVLSAAARKGDDHGSTTSEFHVKNEESTNLEPIRNEILLKSRTKSNSNAALDQPAEKTTLKEKLKCWLLRRPTQDSLRERGIYKDPIFGSTLYAVCKKDGTNVPIFISRCIEAVEKNGISIDGIYRVNGNAAEIQKLRFTVNQNATYDLTSMDIHTVTGALKLFFRELHEPLFPFEFYQSLMTAFAGKTQLEDIRGILDKFPKENYLTLKELLRHLLKVEEHSSKNRMKVSNLAIVFGPTLLWPKEFCDIKDLAQSLMMRGQILEFLLQNFVSIFQQKS